jgi:hypothetical protein
LFVCSTGDHSTAVFWTTAVQTSPKDDRRFTSSVIHFVRSDVRDVIASLCRTSLVGREHRLDNNLDANEHSFIFENSLFLYDSIKAKQAGGSANFD